MDNQFSTAEKAGFHLIGKAVADHRPELLQLLFRWGWQFKADEPAKHLVGAVLETLQSDDGRFHAEFSRMLAAESNFTGDKIAIGADPVSAIAGAVGAVANLAGTAVNRKMVKKAARTATLNAMLQADSQVSAQTQVQPRRENNNRNKKPIWPWLVGAAVLLGGIGLFFLTRS